MGARKLRVGKIVGAALSLSCLGCAHQLTLTPETMPQPPATLPALSVPLVIDLVDATRGGIPESVDDALTNRIAMELRQIGSFPAVIEPIDAHRAPPSAVHVTITVATTANPHTGANNAKAFATGLSLFLLSPVFRYAYDTEARAEASVRTCDGWSKRYESRAGGSLRGGLFGFDEAVLLAGVLDRALVPLAAQIGADAELRARSATAACTQSAAR